MNVVELWRYPVKSAQGNRVDCVEIDERGVVGDRRWAVRDIATGNVLTGRRVAEMLFAVGGDGELTLPSGITTSDNRLVSQWLGRDVELVSSADCGPNTYETPIDPLDGEHEWASWQGPAGSFVDSTRTAVSLISSSSMRTWDHRRFRMNIVLDEPDDVALIGCRVRLGTAVLDVVKAVERCVMVTRPQPGLDRELDVLKTVNGEHGGNLGIGAIVVEPGAVHVGDTIEVLG